MRAIWKRLRQTFWKRSAERELEAELRFHLEMQVEENLARGMSPEQARLEARRAFGGVEQVKEAYRDRRGFRALDSLMQDVRFGLRSLRRNPGFTAVAVLTMALGIGANTAVFSVVNAVIMRPLRFPDPDRLMVILSAYSPTRHPLSRSATGLALDWRERATTFEAIAAARTTRIILSGGGQARYVPAAMVSPEFFPLTGTRSMSGRTFLANEDNPGAYVALLTEEFWRREMGADPAVLTRRLTLNGIPHQIVGVLPAGVRFADFGAVDIWLPFPDIRDSRGGGDVIAIGRLREGITPAIAQSEMNGLMRQIGRERREDSKTYAVVKPLQEWMVTGVRRTFLMLLGAVSFVLLICCANLANLLLARSTARQKELSIRASLGAGRARLVGQTIIESVLLCVAGGVIGAGFAIAAIRAVPAIRAFAIPRVDEISVDLSVWMIAAGLAMLSGIVSALAPALQIGRRDVAAALQQGDSPGAGRVGGLRMRNALVVLQLALALVLLTGAGLMTNTLLRLLNIDLGFQRDRLIAITVSPPFGAYGKEGTTEFLLELANQVRRLPWAGRVGVADNPPLQAVHFGMEIGGVGESGRVRAEARHIAGDYLSVTGIPLFSGRTLEAADDSRYPVPVLVNRTLADGLFPKADPLGRQLRTDYPERRDLEIVGVVGDARQMGLTTDPGAQLYFNARYGFARHILLRSSIDAAHIAPTIARMVHNLDPEVPPPEVTTMNERFSDEIAKPRFFVLLLGAFASTGLFLAAVGIYGVMSYMVARRTREFGIRMALGAAPADVLRLAMNTGLRLVIIGVILGLAGAAATVRVLSSLLFGVKPLDPLTFSATAALLAGVGLAACYAAARKATRADANVALRCE